MGLLEIAAGLFQLMLSNKLATILGLKGSNFIIVKLAGTSGTYQLAYFFIDSRKTWYLYVAAPC